MSSHIHESLQLATVLPVGIKIRKPWELAENPLPTEPSTHYIEHNFMQEIECLEEKLASLLNLVKDKSDPLYQAVKILSSQVDFSLGQLDPKTVSRSLPERKIIISQDGVAFISDSIGVTTEDKVDILLSLPSHKTPVLVRCEIDSISQVAGGFLLDCFFDEMKEYDHTKIFEYVTALELSKPRAKA